MLDLARALPNPAALGIPVAKSFFVKDSLNFLVMELLGHSLETYFQHFHQRLSLKTVLMIGMQVLLLVLRNFPSLPLYFDDFIVKDLIISLANQQHSHGGRFR
jgi:hypothetical protein